jgi:hypothetical protein
MSGLTKCIEKDMLFTTGSNVSLWSSQTAKRNWQIAKEKGERLFKQEYGGSY